MPPPFANGDGAIKESLNAHICFLRNRLMSAVSGGGKPPPYSSIAVRDLHPGYRSPNDPMPILLIIYHYILSKTVLQHKFLPEFVFSHTSNLWKLYTITKNMKKKKTF